MGTLQDLFTARTIAAEDLDTAERQQRTGAVESSDVVALDIEVDLITNAISDTKRVLASLDRALLAHENGRSEDAADIIEALRYHLS